MRQKDMVFAEARPRRDPARERLGRVLDKRFRLEAFIGSGGTGAVYRARVLDAACDLPGRVAIKILHPHLVADDGHRELFLKEARVSALVKHPGAIRVYDARVADDGTAYLVLEYLDGRSLEEALVGWGDLLVDEVVRVTKGVLAILAAAHDSGVVHCDVKPENVLLLADGKVKLLDFGIARIAGGARRTGFAGTAAFMAPEQARGDWKLVDARADVWSVGATFYTLITGATLLDAVTGAGAAGAPTLPAVVPEPIAEVIVRALSTAPADRWPSARAMLEALSEAAAKCGLPRSSRSLESDDDDDAETARPPEVDEATEPFMLVVEPYRVSLDALTTPLPRAIAPAAPDVVLSARAPRRWLIAASVVATAAVLGAMLALALPPGVLERGTRARVPRPASSTRITAGELAR
jgi:serine/threonine-protein kinase